MRLQMQVHVLGLSKTHGIGKESRKPYAMFKVLVGNPMKPFAGGDYNREGVGIEAVEIDTDEGVYLREKDRAFPCTALLDVEQEIRGGKLVPFVVGFLKDK